MKVAKSRGRCRCRGRVWKGDIMGGSGARDLEWDEKWEGKKAGGMENESREGMWLLLLFDSEYHDL